MNRLVPVPAELPVIEREVDVEAADVRFRGAREQEFRNPPADEDDVRAVLAEHTHHFEQNGARRRHRVSRVVRPGYHCG